MKKILIGKTTGLKGSVKIQGGKNAVLPILAASILTEEKVKINNCPDIEDVRQTIKLLEMLGCKVFFVNGTIEVYPKDVEDTRISSEYTRNTRSSILFLGAMLGRLGRIVITKPGGCKIGERPYDLHIKGIRGLGVEIFEKYGDIVAYTDELKGGRIHLTFPSVGATENIMLAAVMAKGRTSIYNPAKEPEIVELAGFLNSMGASVKGAGKDIIVIEGTDRLHGAEYTVGGDRIVAATYMAALAVCRGKIKLLGVSPLYMEEVIKTFRNMGISIKLLPGNRGFVCKNKGEIKNISYIETSPYPMLPTDVQPIMAAVMIYGNGVSRVKEKIFENRFAYVEELKKLGADIKIKGGDTLVIYGKNKLKGCQLKSMDLRGGAALVVAGLGAEGETVILDNGYIYRGYEDIIRDLKGLGADIREEEISEEEISEDGEKEER